MKSLKIFAFLILIAFSFGNLQLIAAPKTLDEITEEQKKKEEEEKKAAAEAKKAEEAKKKEAAAKKAAEEKQKAEEKAEAEKKAAETTDPAVQAPATDTYQTQNQAQVTAGTYTLAEDVIGIPQPLAVAQIDNDALMNADPKAVELFEAAAKQEKEKEALENPNEVMKLWNQLSEITQNNPFAEIAKARFYEWHSVIAVLNKHQENLDKISKLIPSDIIPHEQKMSLAMQHLNEFGITFGTEEILNITKKSESAAAIAKDETFRAKVKEIQTARCNQNSGKDCFNTGKYFAADENEKLAYLDKACGMKYQPACDESKKIKAAAEAEKARIAAEEKRKAEEEAKRLEKEKELQFKDELNKAGRKKRLIIATSTFVPGVVLTILGGVSFVGMNKAEKDRKNYYREYLFSEYPEYAEHYRNKASDADKKRKMHMYMGFAGIGAGVILMVTGITFYSIEFKEEKEVKKKYNVSFGASPADGTLQFALRW